MAISFNKYVSITSAVGGSGSVSRRDLIGRIFTTNPLVPSNTVLEFTTIEDIANYFGTASEEYKRSASYLGWISKSISKAKKISFFNWAQADKEPLIFGLVGSQAVATYTSITAGAMKLTIGGVDADLTGLDFSLSASLADVATVVQTAINLIGGAQFATATVAWNATRQSFDFTGAFNGDEDVEVVGGVADTLGWTDTTAIISAGKSLEASDASVIASEEISNNFASIIFIPQLVIADWEAIGAWNTTKNVMYIACVPVSAANATAWSEALLAYWGLSLTVTDFADGYPEQIPATILASTDYTRRSASQNYMYQSGFSVVPFVTTTIASNLYDSLRTNYYGRTQTAGNVIDFYQRGVLTGGSTAPVDTNVYANEIWLKDEAAAAIMSLLLALRTVSANNQGRGQIGGVIQGVVDKALVNGVISSGKELNLDQKAFVADITGDDLAYIQIQTIGYWYDVAIQDVVVNSITEKKAVYTLIYSKDDAIRKVEGTHALV